MISLQGQAADAAASLKQGQDVVQSALQQRFDDTAGVNVDSGNGEPAGVAEFLCGQCPRSVGGQRHARHSDAVVRTEWRYHPSAVNRRPQIQALVDLRAKLDDLQRQLSTGKKAVDLCRARRRSRRDGRPALAIVGESAATTPPPTMCRRASISRRPRSAACRIISNSVKTAMMQGSYGTGAIGYNTAQTTAQFSLDEMLSLLNTRAGDHYLFSGRATDQPAVESYDHILNGDGTKAGLKQIISEREPGRSRRQRARPPDGHLADRDLAVGCRGCGVAVRLQAGVGDVVADQCGGCRSDRYAAGDLGRSDGRRSLQSATSLTLRFDMPDGTTQNLTLTGDHHVAAGPQPVPDRRRRNRLPPPISARR